jgi:PAS domain S-box-containing protein
MVHIPRRPGSPLWFRLLPKLVVSYVVLGICITTLSLLGGWCIQEGSARRSTGRSMILRRTFELSSMAGSAYEEGFSFVLTGEDAERTKALAKIEGAAADIRGLREETTLIPEERRLLRVTSDAVERMRGAATDLFMGFERTGVVSADRYQAYEAGIDGLTETIDALRASVLAENARDRETSRRTSSLLTVMVGLGAVLIGGGVGGTFARRITRPVFALRDAVIDFGAGNLDVEVLVTSRDELGELASAFSHMMRATRGHIATIHRGQQRLEDVFASLEEVLVVCDVDGTIVSANPACCRLTGHALPALLGKPLTSLFDDVASAAIRDRAMSEATLTTADRTEVPVLLSISRLRGQDQNGWVCVAQNLTERHRLEAELRQAQKMEGLGRLAGGVAHDFNNLLSVILSYSEMLADDLEVNDPMRADLGDIHAAGMRASDLTRQLLAFSRQQVLEAKVLEPNTVILGMERMLRRVLGEDVALATIAAPDAGCVKVDPGQLEQVMMNLAVNARDAMPRGGRLTIETSSVRFDAEAAAAHALTAGAYVAIMVTDTGMGMDAATRARIFEPFFTTKETGKGTGLGLSTVFGIVKQSGGAISVASAPGRGTIFTIHLPLVARDTASAPRDEIRDELPTLRGSETILLVEDEELVRTLACTLLRRCGYDVLEASTAGDASIACEQHAGPIHLLLTDVVMPRMSGTQLARRLCPLRPEMRVLYMSGYTDDEVLRHGILDSNVAFIQKPLTPDGLARKVRHALDYERIAAE